MFEVEIEGRLFRYWNCPANFIPASIYEWKKIYQYHKDFPGATMKSYSEQNPRFIQAYLTYETWVSKFSQEMKRG